MTNQTSENNKRIAKNSLYMSIRMVVVLFISLYTTRAVLKVLGIEDYGIYNVVCGFVSMFSFLNNSMASATQRYYNYELGKNGEIGVQKVYNASMLIHWLLAVIIILFTEIGGLWYLENKLVVPETRMSAAFWIFQFSVVSMFLNIVNVPYISAIMAYERMNYYAYIGIIDAVLKLLIVFALYLSDGDRLILYGFLFMAITVFDYFAYRIYAKKHFKNLRFGLQPCKTYLKEMLEFAGWNLFGSFAYMMRDQGINLLLNAFFGPIVNAARGVANQVNGALQGFTSNILTPARPQIVQSYAKGEYDRSFHLMNSVSKLSCIVFLLMSLPVCLLISPILNMWLGGNVPEHTSSFVIIMLITNTWGSLVAPISAIVHATGKMKFYQTISSASNLMSVPLAYVFLCIDSVPEFVFYALLITMFTNHIAGLISLKRLTSFSIKRYIKNVVLSLACVIVLSVVTTIIPYYFISNLVLKFLVVIVVSVLAVISYSYIICFDQKEKMLINQFVNKFIKRIK